jgi:hypothetical protein
VLFEVIWCPIVSRQLAESSQNWHVGIFSIEMQLLKRLDHSALVVILNELI